MVTMRPGGWGFGADGGGGGGVGCSSGTGEAFLRDDGDEEHEDHGDGEREGERFVGGLQPVHAQVRRVARVVDGRLRIWMLGLRDGIRTA